MKNKLKKSLNKQWAIRLITKHPEGDEYDGVVINLSKEIVIIHAIVDFEFDGINIFPLNFIKSVRDNGHEKCENKIINMNGQIKKIDKGTIFREATTIEECLKKIYQRKIWPAIEIVIGKSDALYVGEIKAGNGKYALQRCYSAKGKWEGRYNIPLNKVVRIEINGRYLKHFNNYMMNERGDR